MAAAMSLGPFVILFTSLLAFPMMYAVNTAQAALGELGLFVAGTACLSVICLLNYFAVRHLTNEEKVDWLLLVFVLGTFAAAVDVTIGLEADGYVSGFMSEYLRDGEPYLGTPYGALISYWDGTAHYAMYAYMLVCMAFRKSYRKVGLYWAGSIGHSMLVLIPGAVVGKFGVRWSFLLNVPYIFIPFISAARFLSERPTENKPVEAEKKKETNGSCSIWRRPHDLFLVASLTASIAITVFRGFAVLGCQHGVTVDYIKFYEPYLNDPVAFPKVQMLVYLFYFVPFYVMAIYGLTIRNTTWLPDWAILFAGAAAQGQVPHMIGSLHTRTAAEYHVPANALTSFYAINVFLLVLPHLLAARCLIGWRRDTEARTQQQQQRGKPKLN